MHRVYIPFLIFSFLSVCLNAQKQSFGILVDAISIQNKINGFSTPLESVDMPFNVRPAFGLVYTRRLKNEDFFLYTSLQYIHYVMEMRNSTYENQTDGSQNIFSSTRIERGKDASFQIGLKYRTTKITDAPADIVVGYNLRRLDETGIDIFHSTVFGKLNYNFWTSKSGKRQLAINFTYNRGFKTIRSVTARIGTTGVAKTVKYNGTFFGVGLTYSFITEGSKLWNLIGIGKK